jgi:hypothetical protein
MSDVGSTSREPARGARSEPKSPSAQCGAIVGVRCTSLGRCRDQILIDAKEVDHRRLCHSEIGQSGWHGLGKDDLGERRLAKELGLDGRLFPVHRSSRMPD